MNASIIRRSLQAKLLIAVIVCAVVPLGAVGAWLSASAVRSGELMLRAQLDSAASRSMVVIQRRWAIDKSDVLLLATSGPVRAAMAAAPTDTAPSYARRAFATMPGISSVVFRDTASRVRWTLAVDYSVPWADRRTGLGPSDRAVVVIRMPVIDDASRPLGEIEAHIRLDSLAPAPPTLETAPSEFVAYRERASGTVLGPSGVPPGAFEDDYFRWNDRRWLAVHRRLEDPAIDVIAAAELDPFLVPFTRTARAGTTALALSAVIVVALTIFVTTRLTRSLGQLATAADRVSRGALETRVQDSSEDEVGRVGRAFNGMLESIARMMRELSQREAAAAMGEIAATMAHQVRSPATAIRLDVQRAHDKLPADAPARALLARALDQLDRMERAVSASLKVTRAARTEFTELDVRVPLERAVSGVSREHAARAVTVDMSPTSSKQLHIRGDASSLEQLFGNVLTNAAQASPDGGRVALSIEANGDSLLTVTIRDHGLGMSPDVLARAGEALFSTKSEGTGLGLAIARRIAAAHGGTIAIESTRHEGTQVAIRLPLI